MQISESKKKQGFTLIELLVVIAIMAIMLTLIATVLRNAGSSRGLTGGIEQLDTMVREARMAATGNNTYSRLVIVSDQGDTGSDSKHLRYMTVMILDDSENKDVYEGQGTDSGNWVATSRGTFLPKGIYFSPKYSTLLDKETAESSGGGESISSRSGNFRITGAANKKGYYIEFDPQGRMTFPGQPTRLVLVNGERSKSMGADEGVVAKPIANGRPVQSGGVVVWPHGTTSRLKTLDQTAP